MRTVLLILALVHALPSVAQPFVTDPTPSWVSLGAGDQVGDGIAGGLEGQSAIVGTFAGEARFGDVALDARATGDARAVFVVQIDATGTPEWARQLGSALGHAASGGIAIDPGGHVVVSGSFTGPLRIDGGSLPDTTLTSRGGADAFVVRFSPEGDLMWSQNVGGEANDQGLSVDVDAEGALALAGSFEGHATWGESAPSSATSRGASDGFVARFDADGALLDLLTYGGPGRDAVRDVSFALPWPDGHRLAVAGTFEDAVPFGDTTFVSRGGTDAFALSYKGASAIASALHLGGPGEDLVTGVAVSDHSLSLGSLVVAGSFEDTLTVDTVEIVSAGETDGFVVGFAERWRQGRTIRALQIGGPEADTATDVTFGEGSYGDILSSVVMASGVYRGPAFVHLPDGDSLALPSRGGADGLMLTFEFDRPYAVVSMGGAGEDGVRAVDSRGWYGDGLVLGTFQGDARVGTQRVSGADGANGYVAEFAPGAVVPFYLSDAPGPTPPRVGVSVSPNPARRAATVTVDLEVPDTLTIEVVDLLGRRLLTLHDGPIAAGPTAFALSLRGFAVGVYVVRAVGTQATSHRFTVTR
ncbi:MAG: T9SS type A sorting domain-containing protein [Bacteroidota bacterium]